jgi:hypothetical protein
MRAWKKEKEINPNVQGELFRIQNCHLSSAAVEKEKWKDRDKIVLMIHVFQKRG